MSAILFAHPRQIDVSRPIWSLNAAVQYDITGSSFQSPGDSTSPQMFRARTPVRQCRDQELGKLLLYQLSYARPGDERRDCTLPAGTAVVRVEECDRR